MWCGLQPLPCPCLEHCRAARALAGKRIALAFDGEDVDQHTKGRSFPDGTRGFRAKDGRFTAVRVTPTREAASERADHRTILTVCLLPYQLVSHITPTSAFWGNRKNCPGSQPSAAGQITLDGVRNNRGRDETNPMSREPSLSEGQIQ